MFSCATRRFLLGTRAGARSRSCAARSVRTSRSPGFYCLGRDRADRRRRRLAVPQRDDGRGPARRALVDGGAATPRSLADLERENRILERRLRRLEENVRQLEEFRDSNSTLLSRLLRDLEEERAKSQRLLLNVLPQRIIDRLNAGEQRIADRHDDVTVLFSDVVGFTEISPRSCRRLSSRSSTSCSAASTPSASETGVEKIKTIGDAYLVVGGLDGDGAVGEMAVAEAALRMRAFAARRAAAGGLADPDRAPRRADRRPASSGTSKFAYDVWGDTVNTASRLETTSEAGRIHVSADLARRLESAFVVEPRGMVDLKGKGPVETYWLVGRRAGAS